MNWKEIKYKELLRFLVGGGSAVLTDYLVYRLLLSADMDISLAKGMSFVGGSIVGFIINKYWTFESKYFKVKEIFRYVILYATTALINALVNNITLSIIDIQIIGFLAATGVSTVLNFLGQKFFVFSNKENTQK